MTGDDFCSNHAVCAMEARQTKERLDKLEVSIPEQLSKISDDWEVKFKGYKDFYNTELEKVKQDVALNFSTITDMKIAMIELKNAINNMSEKFDSFMREYEGNDQDRKVGIIYPIISGVILGIAGVFIGRMFK